MQSPEPLATTGVASSTTVGIGQKAFCAVASKACGPGRTPHSQSRRLICAL